MLNRLRLWARGVWFAMCTPPPIQNGIYYPVYPGEPGYETAHYEVGIFQGVGPTVSVIRPPQVVEGGDRTPETIGGSELTPSA